MGKGWHHIIVRFGPNTTKDFLERGSVAEFSRFILSWPSEPFLVSPMPE